MTRLTVSIEDPAMLSDIRKAIKMIRGVVSVKTEKTKPNPATIAAIEEVQHEMNAETSEIADFWDAFQGLHKSGRCVHGAHFCIKYMRSFRPKGANKDILFHRIKPVLFLDTQAIIAMLGTRGGAAGSGKLFWNSVISYLKTHGSYLGLKQQRFAILAPNGSIDYSYELDVSGRQVKKMKANRPNALCFDYEMLRQEFNLDIEPKFDDVI